MTNEQSSESETTHDSADCIESTHFGLKLKNQRELLNMTQAEAASKLNLDVSYIDAIEIEDFTKMSSTSYVYGYIRSYAKLLKLPEQEILDMYKQISDEHQLLPDYLGDKTSLSSSSTPNKFWSFLIVIIVSLLLVTWWFIRQQ